MFQKPALFSFGAKREVSVVPTRARTTDKSTGGRINKKITENVQAKVTARIQHAIANSELYVLGYVAIERIRNQRRSNDYQQKMPIAFSALRTH